MKSPIEFKGFDYKQGRRYMALNRERTGNVREIGKNEGGSKPAMTRAMGTKIEDDPEGQWIFPERELTDKEKKEIIARCIEIAVRVIVENFCYKFGGKVLIQKEGGPIGARVTMALARLVMQEWSEGYKKILENAGLEIEILTGYVDDVRQVSTCLKMGMRYN